MEFSYHSDICPRIIIKSFLKDEDLLSYNTSFGNLLPHSWQGPFLSKGETKVDLSLKSRTDFVFDLLKGNPDVLNLEKIFWKNFWNKELQEFFHMQGGLFSYLNLFIGTSMRGSFYKKGDYYNKHTDYSLLSCSFFHQDEKNFEGGNLFLTSENSWSEIAGIPSDTLEIPYKNNMLVIFPSKNAHYVSPITKSYKEGVEGMRLGTQIFFSFEEKDISIVSQRFRQLSGT